jgi:hypothetical protein
MTTKWALVPVVATPVMIDEGRRALCDNGCDNVEDSDSTACYAAMLTASPGADLLERIVRAKAAVDNERWHTSAWNIATENLLNLLDELGASEG